MKIFKSNNMDIVRICQEQFRLRLLGRGLFALKEIIWRIVIVIFV